jgi:hypothetical protein
MKRKNDKDENIVIFAGSNFRFYNPCDISKDFKIWTLNGMCEILYRIDLLFDMHEWQTCEYRIPAYYDYLKKKENNYSIVKPYYDRNLRNVIIYPIEEIIKEYGRNLKNSIPQMLLYAWYLKKFEQRKIKNIYLYGISTSEFVKYPDMGFSLFQAIGWVRAKGINVFFVTDCLFDDDDDIYGYYKLTNNRIKD